jgi:hypothetical protein
MHFGEHRVGLASVKKPPPWIGGNCAGSPSTNSSGHSNDIRSRPSSASTIEHSSITISLAFEAGASSHSSKLGCSTPDSRAR